MITGDECPDRLGTDIGSKDEEARSDHLLGATFRSNRAEASSGEEPQDDEAGERFDQAVGAEPDQRDRAGGEPGNQSDCELDEMPNDASPSKKARLPLDPARSPGLALGAGRCATDVSWTSGPRAGSGMGLLLKAKHARHQSLTCGCQLVHHHLAVSTRADESLGPKRAKMMRHEILGTLADPGEIAAAQLARLV